MADRKAAVAEHLGLMEKVMPTVSVLQTRFEAKICKVPDFDFTG